MTTDRAMHPAIIREEYYNGEGYFLRFGTMGGLPHLWIMKGDAVCGVLSKARVPVAGQHCAAVYADIGQSKRLQYFIWESSTEFNEDDFQAAVCETLSVLQIPEGALYWTGVFTVTVLTPHNVMLSFDKDPLLIFSSTEDDRFLIDYPDPRGWTYNPEVPEMLCPEVQNHLMPLAEYIHGYLISILPEETDLIH